MKPKNGEGRNFPLTPDLRAVLEAQRERVLQIQRSNGQIILWVFVHPSGEGRAAAGSPIKDVRGAWAKACRDAGVPGRLLHDFRRTAVRNLERAGFARSAVMKMVGHRTEAIYRRYAITDDAIRRRKPSSLRNSMRPRLVLARSEESQAMFVREIAIDASKGLEFLVLFLECRGGETADAVDSKSTVGNHMRVQVPPSAPK